MPLAGKLREGKHFRSKASLPATRQPLWDPDLHASALEALMRDTRTRTPRSSAHIGASSAAWRCSCSRRVASRRRVQGPADPLLPGSAPGQHHGRHSPHAGLARQRHNVATRKVCTPCAPILFFQRLPPNLRPCKWSNQALNRV